MFYNIPDEYSGKWCGLSQYYTGIQTKNLPSMFFTDIKKCNLQRNMKACLCRLTKIADLPCVSICRATVFECFPHIRLSLRQGTHFFYKKLSSGLGTQSFLAFCDFEYSKFRNSFLTVFINRTTGKRKHGLIIENK